MPDKIFIDTNIVIYALGPNSTKAQIAAPLFINFPHISTQVLSETANVAVKRLSLSVSDVKKLITTLESICVVETISLLTIHSALSIQERYSFSYYDSLIVSTAIEAGCSRLYSEDMQNGQEIDGHLQIINPFA